MNNKCHHLIFDQCINPGCSRITLLILAALFLVSSSFSQSIIRSTTSVAGSSQELVQNGKSYFISQSIGQASAIGTITKGQHQIRQGFQQPPGSIEIGKPHTSSGLDALVYPNPFDQAIDIMFEKSIQSDIQIYMYDVSGRSILVDTYKAAQLITLNLGHLPGGSYVLNVIADQKQFTRILIKH